MAQGLRRIDRARRLVAEGSGSSEIGHQLGISRRQVYRFLAADQV